MNAKIISFSGLFVSIVAVCLLTACKIFPPEKPRAFEISVEVDKSIAQSSILVDLTGASPSERSVLEEYSPNQWFQPDDPKRKAAERDRDRITFEFGSGQPTRQVVKSINPIWKLWNARGVDHVVVMADIPGLTEVSGGLKGDANPKRKTLSLFRKDWKKGTTTLKLVITEGGIRVDTPVRVAN